MSKLKPVFELLEPVFKELGLKKQGNNFYKHCGQNLIIMNFQGSQSGVRFYLNVGTKEISNLNKVGPKDVTFDGFPSRIDLFSDTQGWLYSMCGVELNIMSRKIKEYFKLMTKELEISQESVGV